MAVTIATMQAAVNTSSGTQDFTTADLGGLTPKGALLSFSEVTVNGTPVDDLSWAIGFTDGTQSEAMNFHAVHAVTTTDTGKRATADPIILANPVNQDMEVRGEFSAWITDGIRLNWPASEVPGAAFLLNIMFFAGDISVDMGNIAAPTTEDATVDITTIGFEPDFVFGMYALQIAGTADDKGGHHRSTWGVASNEAGGIVQRSIGFQDRNGVTTSDNRSVFSELYMCRAASNTGGGFGFSLEASDFDANGFSIIARDGARSDSDFYWLAIKLDGSTDWNLQTYNTPTSTGDDVDTTPGFEPQALVIGTTMAEAVDTVDLTNTIGGAYGVAFADEDDVYSLSSASDSGLTTTDASTLVDNSVNLPNEDNSAGLEAAIPSGGIFQSTGFTLDFSAVETAAKKWWVLAIEGVAGGALTQKSLAGTMTSSGALKKKTLTSLAGVLTSSGALSTASKFFRSLAGTLTSSGTVSTVRTRFLSLAGTLTSSGAISTAVRFSIALAGTLTSSGTVTTVHTRFVALAGLLTSSGSIKKTTKKAFAGTMTSAGSIAKITKKSLAGLLTSSATLVKKTSVTIVGVLTSSSAIVKKTAKSFSGTLTSSGIVSAFRPGVLFFQAISGTLTSSGSLTKKTRKNLSGLLSSSGTIRRKIFKSFTGTLTSSGTLVAARTFFIELAGTLTSSGTIKKLTKKSLAGTITSSATVVKKTFKSFAGSLTSSGAIATTTATIKRIALNLRARSFGRTLEDRDFGLSLRSRSFTVTFKKRAFAIVLRFRTFALNFIRRDTQ